MCSKLLIQVLTILSLVGLIAAMWPQPLHYDEGSAVLWFSDHVKLRLTRLELQSAEFQAHWRKTQNTLNAQSGTPPQARLGQQEQQQCIEAAFDRIKTSILSDRFVPDKFYRSDFDFDPIVADDRVSIGDIVINLHESPDDLQALSSHEAYTLDITEAGQVAVHAISHLGALHALQTFRQLFYAHSDPQAGIYLRNAPVHIADSPRFEHRGLNLDIARNRIFPEDVMRTLDAMAAQKLNRLHLHATDSQSWPLDIPSMPELARKGAYHRSQIWSSQHLEQVQLYASERGIDLYVEIDMPGHTGSIIHSHPDLVVAYGKKWDVYAKEPPAGQLKLADQKVKEFISRLLDDLQPRLTSNKFHVGCDEVNLESYEFEPGLETSDKETLKPYVQAFFHYVFKLLETQGRTPVAWEEIILDWDLELPASTIIQSWRSQQSLAEITARGHRAIFGPSSHWYLDCGLGGWEDPEPGNPDTKVKLPFGDWCPPYKNWRLVYSYDPLQGVPTEHHHLIIGGEAHLWGELTDSVTLDGMLWPRLAAAAEVLWRGPREVNEDATRRLAEMRERLVIQKIATGMVQMEWCLKNPNSCYL